MGGMTVRRRTRLAALLCSLVLLCAFLTLPASATEFSVPDTSRANAVYLYQLENDRVLLAQQTSLPVFPASTVKIMTGLVAVEALQGRYSEAFEITQAMVDAASGFRMYLNPGERVTVEQMLYAAICAGYNDACIVLAYHVAGSVEAFVALMNERAAQLGMIGTMYTNPTGLHNDRMVTTAEDTARLALTAMENEAYMEIVSAVKYTMAENNLSPARTFYNRNALIARNITSRYYNGYVTGLNAGTTTEGGYCVVASAEDEEQGLRYLCIVMGADEDPTEEGGTIYSYQIANDLLHHAMNDYGMCRILDPDTVMMQVEVGLTERQGTLSLVPREEVMAYLPRAVEASMLNYRAMLHEETVNAPIRAGDVLGVVTVSYDGVLLANVDLCAAEDVEQSEFLAGMARISEYTSDRRFWLSGGYALLLLLIYFVLLPYLRKRRNRKRAKYF